MIFFTSMFIGVLMVLMIPICYSTKAYIKEKKTGKYDTAMAAMPMAVVFGFLPVGVVLGFFIFLVRYFY